MRSATVLLLAISNLYIADCLPLNYPRQLYPDPPEPSSSLAPRQLYSSGQPQHLSPRQLYPSQAPHARRQSRKYAVVNVDGGSTAASPPEADVARRDDITSYSVVNVDGGTSAASTSTSPPSSPTETILATTTISTVSMATETVTHLATSLSSSSPLVTVMTVPASTVTVVSMETPVPVSTSYYDDGMWHTYYPVKTFAVQASASTASSSCTSTSSATSTESQSPSGTVLEQNPGDDHRKTLYPQRSTTLASV